VKKPASAGNYFLYSFGGCTVPLRVLPLMAAIRLLAPAASAVNVDWLTVGGPASAGDATGFGAVA
jgi:hypothetical protein